MNYLATKLHGSLLTVIKQTAIEKLRTATMLVYIKQKKGGERKIWAPGHSDN